MCTKGRYDIVRALLGQEDAGANAIRAHTRRNRKILSSSRSDSFFVFSCVPVRHIVRFALSRGWLNRVVVPVKAGCAWSEWCCRSRTRGSLYFARNGREGVPGVCAGQG